MTHFGLSTRGWQVKSVSSQISLSVHFFRIIGCNRRNKKRILHGKLVLSLLRMSANCGILTAFNWTRLALKSFKLYPSDNWYDFITWQQSLRNILINLHIFDNRRDINKYKSSVLAFVLMVEVLSLTIQSATIFR